MCGVCLCEFSSEVSDGPMAVKQIAVRVRRWQGGQHPTLSNITRLVIQEGLRPYIWENAATLCEHMVIIKYYMLLKAR